MMKIISAAEHFKIYGTTLDGRQYSEHVLESIKKNMHK